MCAQHSFPVAVIQDRYGGGYSGGAWIAIAGADHLENGAYRIVRCLEDGPHGQDIEAREFWADPPWWIAVGSSPTAAVEALDTKCAEAEGLLAGVDRKIQAGSDDLDAGRLHTVDEVRAFLRGRSSSRVDAAG